MEANNKPAVLNWDEYWKIALRRRWSFLGPFFAVGLLGFAAAHLWPVLYRSNALILVEQQGVPRQYVTPNVVTNLEAQLQSITQQILSRARLQQLIQQLDLYPEERSSVQMDELVDNVRKDIEIEPVRADQTGELTAFRIAYAAPSPRVAQQVVNQLTSLFIEQNLQSQVQQSTNTTDFLKTQVEQARQTLSADEERLRDYKMKYLGQLPEQEQSNLQILSSVEGQLSAASGALDRDQQEEAYLEAMQSQYALLEQSLDGGAEGAGTDPETTLIRLRAQLADLEGKYRPRYPDVVRLKKEIAKWEAIVQKPPTKQAVGALAGKAAPAVAFAGDPKVMEVTSRLKALRAEMQARRKDVANLRRRIQVIEADLNLTPIREEQLAEVTRDEANAKQYYESLLQKESQSHLATSLEEQQGEQFRIIDPASLPLKPAQPNRLEIVLAGWVLGLIGGVGFVAFQEATDSRLRTEQEIRSCTAAPILAFVPLLTTPQDAEQQKTRRYLEWAGIALLLLLVSIGAAIF